MAKKMKKTTDRAKACKCVRFDDKKGFRTKFNKTNFPNESRKEVYYFSMKFVEQGMRGLSATSVAKKKKFQKFRKASEGLKLEFSLEGFQYLTYEQKRVAVEQVVEKFADEIAAAMSLGTVQADSSDHLQAGSGSARLSEVPIKEGVPMEWIQEDSEGVEVEVSPEGFKSVAFSEMRQAVEKLVETVVDHGPVQADSSDHLQAGSGSARLSEVPIKETHGEIQVDGGWAATASLDLGKTLLNLQNIEWSQWNIPVSIDALVSTLSNIKRRSLGFPGRLPDFVWSEKDFRSYINRLESLEDAVLEDVFEHSFKMPFLPVYGPLDSSAYEEPQNVTGMPEVCRYS